MLHYEIARKLKNAGFPYEWDIESDDSGFTEHGGVVYKAPTLSELIEACGEKFSRLVQTFEPKGWEAKTTDVFDRFTTIGSIPEEAVASLWLALNKKS